LDRVGKGIALFAIAVTPWLPIIVPAVVVVFWQLRRRQRLAAATTAA
jgi:hypothetical protein